MDVEVEVDDGDIHADPTPLKEQNTPSSPSSPLNHGDGSSSKPSVDIAPSTPPSAASRSPQLRKALGWRQLVSLGVGCTIGAGTSTPTTFIPLILLLFLSPSALPLQVSRLSLSRLARSRADSHPELFEPLSCRRHLRGDRAGGKGADGSRAVPVLHLQRPRLSLLRPVLRRVRCNDAERRERVRVREGHHGRARGVRGGLGPQLSQNRRSSVRSPTSRRRCLLSSSLAHRPRAALLRSTPWPHPPWPRVGRRTSWRC